MEEMKWEVLPHLTYSPDLLQSGFHLFGPLKEALGGKDLEPTMKLNVLCNDGWIRNHKVFFFWGGGGKDILKLTKK
jgi:hypothetical protein